MSFDIPGFQKCQMHPHRASGLQTKWRIVSPGVAAQGWGRYPRAYDMPLKN